MRALGHYDGSAEAWTFRIDGCFSFVSTTAAVHDKAVAVVVGGVVAVVAVVAVASFVDGTSLMNRSNIRLLYMLFCCL